MHPSSSFANNTITRALSGLEKVEGDAVAAVVGEEGADPVVAVRPVGPHGDHVVALEGAGHFGGCVGTGMLIAGRVTQEALSTMESAEKLFLLRALGFEN